MTKQKENVFSGRLFASSNHCAPDRCVHKDSIKTSDYFLENFVVCSDLACLHKRQYVSNYFGRQEMPADLEGAKGTSAVSICSYIMVC